MRYSFMALKYNEITINLKKSHNMNPNHLKSLFRLLAYSRVELSQYNCRNEAIIVANTRYSREGAAHNQLTTEGTHRQPLAIRPVTGSHNGVWCACVGTQDLILTVISGASEAEMILVDSWNVGTAYKWYNN